MDDLYGGQPADLSGTPLPDPSSGQQPDPSGGQPGAPAGQHPDPSAGQQPEPSAGQGADALYAGEQANALYDEQQVSWLDVPAHAPVVASDGTQVGTVLEVAALANEDIFHGIVFQHGGRGQPVLAPASDVAKITDRAVYLSVDSGAAAAYGEFQQLHVSRLGLRGISRWKHLGWKDSSE
jgi:hypothetical protein